jgi:hypothetical protein
MPDLDDMIEAAKRIGGHKTKKAAATAALDEYVRRLKRQQAFQAFGTFDFDPEYDYTAERKVRGS